MGRRGLDPQAAPKKRRNPMADRNHPRGRGLAPWEHPLPETVAEAEMLAARIERAVQQQTCGRIRDLRVEVSREGVLLSGRCPTYYCKQLAQTAAMEMPGNFRLTNELEVY